MSKFCKYDAFFIALTVLALFTIQACGEVSTDLSTAPSLTSSDSVQYFYLESSFPYNTPQNIK
jgi:hypothetical protein